MTPLPPELEALSDDQANAIAQEYFEKYCGRPHPWEGAQSWVIAAIKAADKAALERAATKATSLATDAAIKYANGYPVDFEKEVGDAIRGMK